MKRIYFLFLIVALATVSCSAPQRIIYREAEMRNLEPTQNAIVVPLLAELEVISKERVSEVFEYDVVVTTAILGDIETYKRTSLLNTVQKYNADTMVGALVSVDTNKSGKLEITVTGYPARYINFRPMQKEDAWLSQVVGGEAKATNTPQNKKNGLANLFGADK